MLKKQLKIHEVTYTLILSNENQNKKLKKLDGYCDTSKKQIVIRNPNGVITPDCQKWHLNRLVYPVVKREFDLALQYELQKAIAPSEALP